MLGYVSKGPPQGVIEVELEAGLGRREELCTITRSRFFLPCRRVEPTRSICPCPHFRRNSPSAQRTSTRALVARLQLLHTDEDLKQGSPATIMAALAPSSPRLPSPPPPAEIQLGPKSPSMGAAASRQAQQMEQSINMALAKRRIHPGTKAAEFAAGPPLVPLSEVSFWTGMGICSRELLRLTFVSLSLSLLSWHTLTRDISHARRLTRLETSLTRPSSSKSTSRPSTTSTAPAARNPSTATRRRRWRARRRARIARCGCTSSAGS